MRYPDNLNTLKGTMGSRRVISRSQEDDKICCFSTFFTRSSLLTLYISFRFSFKDDQKAAKRKRLEAYIRVSRGANGKANEEIAEQLFFKFEDSHDPSAQHLREGAVPQ